LVSLSVPIASCSAKAAEEPSAVSELRASTGSTDPLEHLKVIAGPDMDGRGTPSVGLDKAVDYVVAECTRAGLAGGIANGVYKQPYRIGGQSANNILAVLPGSGPHQDEVVLVSAHLDHLGQGFPGADDNGSGSAALLAIANRLVAERPTHPLNRSVGFLWTTGEEEGLVGSTYFVEHPPATLPLTSIAQVINLDALGALEETRFSILPDDASNTAESVLLLTDASRELDPPFTRINRDLEAYTRRTDAYSFVSHHVPTVWVFEGLTNPEGGGRLMARYHKPTDTVENLVAENGGNKLRRMTEMLTKSVEKIANATFFDHETLH
jgi:aminopeptidase YwaD